MSGPGEGEAIPHEPPKPFPVTSLVGINVPQDFNQVIIKESQTNGITYEEQLLRWAQAGELCSRIHDAGRNIRK